MRLEVEQEPRIENPSEGEVRAAIMRLRSYGPSSYGSLIDDEGSYVQAAGGGVTSLLERHDAASGRHYRAFHHERSPVFADGTRLAFSGGEIELAADEWFSADAVAEAFVAFLKKEPFPATIKWRDKTENIFSIRSLKEDDEANVRHS